MALTFYSNDPVGALGHLKRTNSIQGFNRYTYAYNNPYKYTDSDGQLPLLIPVVIFIAKELAAEAASQATGGATDFLSVRRTGTKLGKFAVNKLAKGVQDGNKEIAKQASKNILKSFDSVDSLVKSAGNLKSLKKERSRASFRVVMLRRLLKQ